MNPSACLAGCRHLAVPIVALGVLGGCSNELLMTNYAVAPSNPGFVAAVRQDRRSVTEGFGGTPCVLTVDNTVRPITSRKSGTLGQPGFNVAISAANPSNAVTTNAAACPTISSLAINLGSGSEVLDIGSTTTSGRLDAIVDGTTYSTDQPDSHFSATITGQNPAEDTVSARFEAIASAPPVDPQTSPPPLMFVAEGSFNIR